jgi:hypothetical protein
MTNPNQKVDWTALLFASFVFVFILGFYVVFFI